MPLTINTNMASIQSERALAMNRGNMETAMQRLSSGKRINSALDDASGLAVANRMRNQVEGLNMAIRNANDGISLSQTAEGAMEELQNVLLRMRELAVQASNGTYTDEDRSYIAAEFDELMKEMRRVSNQAAWDGDVQLIAEGAKPQQVQVGVNAAEYIQIPLQSLTIEDLKLSAKKDVVAEDGTAIDTFKFHDLTSSTEPKVAFVPSSWTRGVDSPKALKDITFTDIPLPNFELKLWNGARDSSGSPEGLSSSVNLLKVAGAASVLDLITRLKAHPNFDATTCDIQFSAGELKVVWKIAGQPNPSSSLIITNPPGSTTPVTIGAGAHSVTYGSNTVSGVANDLTNYPKHFEQDLNLSALTFYRDTIPKSAGNFFSIQIGDRVLTADNAVDVADLAGKLMADSDYNFVRDKVGLGQSKIDLFDIYDVAANKNWDGSALTQTLAAAAMGSIYTDTGGQNGTTANALYVKKGRTGSTNSTAENAKDKVAGNVSGRSIDQAESDAATGEIFAKNYSVGGSAKVYKIKGTGATTGFAGNVSGELVTQTRTKAAIGEIYYNSTTTTYAIKTDGADYAADIAHGSGPGGAITLAPSLVDLDTVALLAESKARKQKLVINFGENATDRACMYQSHHNVAITDAQSAISALDYVDAAAKVVNEARARMGATMSRIEFTINNLMNLVENTEEAKSRVLDTDYARESAELAKAQILAQAGTAMLAQANQSQQYVLNLLRQG